MPPEKGITVARLAVESNGLFLLVRRSLTAKRHRGLWELPGGQPDLEIDENLKDTGIRETGEETGGLVTEVTSELVTVHAYPMDGDRQGQMHETQVALARVAGGAIDITDNPEVIATTWQTREAILRSPALVYATRLAVQDFIPALQ